MLPAECDVTALQRHNELDTNLHITLGHKSMSTLYLQGIFKMSL
jgi:hypothetical protein